jgi:hypothetical protein
VALSSGTVLFFEDFHGLLAFEGPAYVNIQAGQSCFSAEQASKHVLMFGALLANGSATWCGAIAQSGLSVKSSQRTNQRRQSAIRHRLGNCPSCGGQRQGSRWQANAQRASRSRGFATPVRRSKSHGQRSQASRPRRPMCHAIALSPGIIEFWPGGQASGKMSENQIEGAWLCTGQTSISKARFACSQRPLLRAPA